jgi:hypothetical protein
MQKLGSPFSPLGVRSSFELEKRSALGWFGHGRKVAASSAIALGLIAFLCQSATAQPASQMQPVSIKVSIVIDRQTLPGATGGSFIFNCWTERIFNDTSGTVSFGQEGTTWSTQTKALAAIGEHGSGPASVKDGQQRSTYCSISIQLQGSAAFRTTKTLDGTPIVSRRFP